MRSGGSSRQKCLATTTASVAQPRAAGCAEQPPAPRSRSVDSSYGGSMNTASNGGSAASGLGQKTRRRLARTTVPPSRPSRREVDADQLARPGACPRRTSRVSHPRLSASIPAAPVPANRSRKPSRQSALGLEAGEQRLLDSIRQRPSSAARPPPGATPLRSPGDYPAALRHPRPRPGPRPRRRCAASRWSSRAARAREIRPQATVLVDQRSRRSPGP